MTKLIDINDINIAIAIIIANPAALYVVALLSSLFVSLLLLLLLLLPSILLLLSVVVLLFPLGDTHLFLSYDKISPSSHEQSTFLLIKSSTKPLFLSQRHYVCPERLLAPRSLTIRPVALQIWHGTL